MLWFNQMSRVTQKGPLEFDQKYLFFYCLNVHYFKINL